MSPTALRIMKGLARRQPGLSTGSWYVRWSVAPSWRGYAMSARQWSTLKVWYHYQAHVSYKSLLISKPHTLSQIGEVI